jgi:carotenoid cleavage dioxygenase-like enzyme
VVPKAAPDTAQWFEAAFTAAYHFGDAFQRNGRIVMRTVRHANIDEARSPMREAMAGDAAHAVNSNASLRELHLDLRTGKAHWEDTGIQGIEFPLFDTRSAGNRGARLYAPAMQGDTTAPYFNAVAGYDVARGRREAHRYGRDILAEEHVFVPRPGSRNADDGWLVGTLLDAANQRSGIAVLDAQRIDEGPVAQAWLPYAVPLGFHGTFAAQG